MIKVSIENAHKVLPLSGVTYTFNTTLQDCSTELMLAQTCMGVSMWFDAMAIFRAPDQVCFSSGEYQMTISGVKFFEINKQTDGHIVSFNVVCSCRLDTNKLIRYKFFVR